MRERVRVRAERGCGGKRKEVGREGDGDVDRLRGKEIDSSARVAKL